MKQQNICKFPLPSLQNPLTVSQFVLETDAQTMSQRYTLTAHRMLLVTGGEGIMHFDRTDVPFATGDLLFGFLGESFSVRAQTDVSYLYISFAGPRADELLHRFHIQLGNRSFAHFDSLIPMWSESLSRANEITLDLAAESILLYTFSRLFGTYSPKNDLISRIIELTEQSFSSPTLSLFGIAAELSYNPKYLSHLFKQKVGISYSEYLRSVRIKYAITLFDHGLDSIKNVAFLCGFSDPLYFSSVFRAQVGLSPTEYLKQKEPQN